MATTAITISPENLEVAQSYLALTDRKMVAQELRMSLMEVDTVLNKPEVKRFIDNVYLDSGYRNRHRIGDLMDELIESKLEEARETGIYTKKDLAELLEKAHKMRMEEIKAAKESDTMHVKTQNNLQINAGEGGNLGALVSKLIEAETSET